MTFVLPGGAPGLLVKGNIDISARTFVAVPVGNGKFASVRTVSWEITEGLSDQEGTRVLRRYGLTIGSKGVPNVLVPTVIRGPGKWMIVSDKGALNHSRSTGRHLGIFDTPGHATSYAIRLHQQQAAAARQRRLARQRQSKRR